MMLVVDCVLLALLACVGVAVWRSRDLLTAVALFSIYSLLCAALFTLLEAPDVAVTEAAVGAGFSTMLMLAAIATVGRSERRRKRPPLVAAAVVLTAAGCLAWGLAAAPPFGQPDAPPHVHVAPFYLRDTATAIDIPNVVTAVLASYRGFDTLGEVAVIFTAGIGVLTLLGLPRRLRFGRPVREPRKVRASATLFVGPDHVVPRVVGKIVLPAILMYALYIQFHGEVGPGGGFAAGVMLATGFALYALLFGVRRARQAAPAPFIERAAAAGLLLYLGVGVLTVALGGSFLDYDTLGDAPTGQHIGIMLVEMGVGATVAATMIAVFSSFALFATRSRAE
jgi:multicomponent Na+:H+ antiporter subunit B